MTITIQGLRGVFRMARHPIVSTQKVIAYSNFERHGIEVALDSMTRELGQKPLLDPRITEGLKAVAIMPVIVAVAAARNIPTVFNGLMISEAIQVGAEKAGDAMRRTARNIAFIASFPNNLS